MSKNNTAPEADEPARVWGEEGEGDQHTLRTAEVCPGKECVAREERRSMRGIKGWEVPTAIREG